MALKIREKKKIGLVLSGGGIKAAAFHIGVCLALREKGFKFAGGTKDQVSRIFGDDPMTVRLYVGSSAGAFVCSILSAGYSLEALVDAFEVGVGERAKHEDHSLRYLRAIGYKDVFSINSTNILKSIPLSILRKSFMTGGLETLLKERFKVNGIFTTRGIEKYLSQYALSHDEFRQLGVDLYVIGTQLNHTRKAIFGNFPESFKTKSLMYINHAKISEAVAASVALPPVFAPYPITNPANGKDIYFFDGEIRDSLSTHVATDNGADLVIASYSYQPYHYTDEIGSLHNYGIPVIANQALYQVIQQKIERNISYKNDIRAIYNAIDGYFKQANLGDEHREKILEIIRNRVNYKPNADYIYIHPRAQNYEMFFADHFSLSPQILERIVRIGFKSALSQLRNYDL
jgi:predicted acylesterase/phospholipase RssA